MIGLYAVSCVDYFTYDKASPRVAALLAGKLQGACAGLKVEHIGSTAVPGCAGRGIIDLLVLYKSGTLEEAQNALERLGFQVQDSPEPFLDGRPILVGTVEYLGRTYSVHAHVREAVSAEVLELVKFRDLLRANAGLRLAYEMEKRGILARGHRMNPQYAKGKSDFIRHVLNADRF